MNAKEAIDEIKRQRNQGVKAFAVLSMDNSDVDMYMRDAVPCVYREYSKMSDTEKSCFLSLIMDEALNTIEEHERYGFRRIIVDAIIGLESNYAIDEIYNQARQTAKAEDTFKSLLIMFGANNQSTEDKKND